MDHVVRWFLIERALAPDAVLRHVPPAFRAGDGRVRTPSFTAEVVDRETAIARGLERAALAGWGTVLQLTPVAGTDEWSYAAHALHLQRGFLDAQLRSEFIQAERTEPGPAGPSIREKLRRVRPPRVELRYDLPDSMTAVVPDKALPFVIGVMGELAAPGAAAKPLERRRFQRLDRDNGDKVASLLGHPPGAVSITGEAASRHWHDLRWLASTVETGPMLQVLVCPITKAELAADFARAQRLEDSWLWRQLTVEEFYSPFSIMVGAFDFAADDAPLLGKMAACAATGLTPLLLAAAGSGGLCAEPAADSWRRIAGPAAHRYVAWAGADAPDIAAPGSAGLNAAMRAAQRLAAVVDNVGWCAGFDGTAGASTVAPPGLGALLCATHIGHTISHIVAGHGPELGTRAKLADYLARWLARFVMTAADGAVVRAARPLRAATAELADTPDGLAVVLSLDLAFQAEPAHSRIQLTVPAALKPLPRA